MSKRIQLTQGKFAIVDEDDFENLNRYKWSAHWSPGMGSFRAVRHGEEGFVYMHRQITNAKDGFVVDHINHNMLDNRKENLRVVTQSENMQNRRVNKKNTSGYKGVSWNSKYKKWYCQITVENKNISLGHFDDPEEAARAYDNAAKEKFGEFASLNFPD